MKRIILIVAIAIVSLRGTVFPHAYYPRAIGGQLLNQRWPAGTAVPFYVHSSVLTAPNIAAGSDPLEAIVSAFGVWEGVSSIRFSYQGVVSDRGESMGRDGVNSVTFADTAVNRQFIGNFGGYTIFFSDASGRIIESDIAFNPASTWRTVGTTGSLFSLVVHELGHTLGLDHSGVMVSTMNGPPSGLGHMLSSDDIAAAQTLYPLSDTATTTGSVSGVVTAGGAPVFGAHVVFSDSTGSAVASAMTDTAGRYQVAALPPGVYTPMAEPFNGPMVPTTLGGTFYRTLNANFRSAIGEPFTVNAGETASIDIAAEGGAWTLNPTSPTYGAATNIVAGVSGVGFLIAGTNIDRVANSDIEITGSGVRITSVFRVTSGGAPAAQVNISADANAAPGLRSIILRSSGEVAFIPGAIRVRAPQISYVPALMTGLVQRLGEMLRTGVAFVTDSIRSSTLTYTAYNSSGATIASAINPSTASLAASTQRAALDSEIFGANPAGATQGWAQLRSTEPGSGLFLVFDSEFSRITDGTGLVRTPSRDVILPFGSSSERVMFSIANPNDTAATLSLEFTVDNGAVLSTASRTLNARGSTVEVWPADARSGYLRVRSNVPVVATELFGTNDLSALTGTPGQRTSSAVFPHFAVGAGYTTEISVVNADSAAATIDLQARSDSGVLIGTVSRQLLPGQRFVESVASMFGLSTAGFTGGYITATTTSPTLLAGYTRFVYGGTGAATAVLLDASPKRRLFFPHVAHGVAAGGNANYLTGIAIVNSDAANTARVMVTALAANGSVAASARLELGPGEKKAALLNELGAGFANLRQGNGSVIVSSDRALFGYELFFTDTLSILAAVPAP